MKIQYIDVKHVNVMWPYLEPYITLTIEESGIHEYSAEQFKVRLIDGSWSALVAVDDDNEIQGAAVVNYLVTRAGLSDDLVYKMIKGVFESRDELVAAHQAARDIKLEQAMQGMPIPMHPGAEKYLREKGVLK